MPPCYQQEYGPWARPTSDEPVAGLGSLGLFGLAFPVPSTLKFSKCLNPTHRNPKTHQPHCTTPKPTEMAISLTNPTIIPPDPKKVGHFQIAELGPLENIFKNRNRLPKTQIHAVTATTGDRDQKNPSSASVSSLSVRRGLIGCLITDPTSTTPKSES